jgi:tRNA threonylcarbamoyl adenosine modification protein (Sua5/YciO/YrdC/YwlC family)
MAEFISINPSEIDDDTLSMATECLVSGGVLIYPTDTIYAMGCSLKHPQAIERMARVKDIRVDKAVFSLIFHDFAEIANYTRPVNTAIYKLMKRCLPGPFTFILNASSNISRLMNTRRKTVGVRIPDNNIIVRLVESIGCPIVSTSLHDEDEIIKFPTDPMEIFNHYEDKVDMVIDGGHGQNEESTVIDCTTEEPLLVRQGAGQLD